MWVVAKAHLCDGLHFFVFLIQARARDAVPEEFYQSVHVSIVSFIQFWNVEVDVSEVEWK